MKSGNKVFFSAAGIAFAATITMAQSVAAQDNPQQVKKYRKDWCARNESANSGGAGKCAS
jgi:hypothetical protein